MKDLEFKAPLTPEELPPGECYVGAYCGAETKTYFEELKLRLDFELLEPAGLIVCWYCPYPGHDRNRRHSKGSKFYKLWCAANGRPPIRGQRMSTKVFAGYWKLRIRWGVSNGKGGLSKGELTYPVVDTLLERVAGGPTVNSDVPAAAELLRSFAQEGPSSLIPEVRGR